VFLLDWRLALISLAVLPVIAFVSQQFQRLMRASYRQQRVRLAKVNAFLQENISGMLVVQLFNREQRKFEEFDALNEDYLQANLGALKVFAYFFPVVSFLATLATALLLWYGSGGVLDKTVSLGVLVAFFQYPGAPLPAVPQPAEKYNIMQAAMAAAERVFLLLDEQPTIVDPPNPKSFGAAEYRVPSTEYRVQSRAERDS